MRLSTEALVIGVVVRRLWMGASPRMGGYLADTAASLYLSPDRFRSMHEA
jgi:hypothetical protein